MVVETADMGVYVCHPYGEGESRETAVLKGFKTRHLDHSSAAAMAVVWQTFSTGTTLANDFFHFVDGSNPLTCLQYTVFTVRPSPQETALRFGLCSSVCPSVTACNSKLEDYRKFEFSYEFRMSNIVWMSRGYMSRSPHISSVRKCTHC